VRSSIFNSRQRYRPVTAPSQTPCNRSQSGVTIYQQGETELGSKGDDWLYCINRLLGQLGIWVLLSSDCLRGFHLNVPGIYESLMVIHGKGPDKGATADDLIHKSGILKVTISTYINTEPERLHSCWVLKDVPILAGHRRECPRLMKSPLTCEVLSFVVRAQILLVDELRHIGN
jgi:hypothetical protein